MKSSRAILGLILLLGLALIALLIFGKNPPQTEPTSLITTRDSHDSLPDEDELPELASSAQAPVGTPSSRASSAPQIAEDAVRAPEQFESSLRSCAPERQASTLESLLTSLESETPAGKQTQWRNYVLTWGDGSERRVMVTPKENANTRFAWDIKFFSVDAEGLPVPEELPANVEGPGDLARLLSMGEVRGGAEAYQIALNSAESLLIERRDGRITDFQWRRGDKSMLCSVERCTCLR